MTKRLAAIAAPVLLVLAVLVAMPSGPAGAAGAAGSGGSGGSGGYAPLDRPGPALSVPRTALDASVTCSGDFRANDLEPVLLNPATGVTAKENYSWNYEKAFTAQHRPWCAVTPPHHTLDDIQVSGEYIVNAIRHTHALAGRPIAVVGHSQGGMSMRWALRFWPDTRPMVADVVGLAPDNHGTTVVDPLCVEGRNTCIAHQWQQRSQEKSKFIQALNSRAETFAGVSYTNVYSRTDEVVQPTSGPRLASGLYTGAGRIANVKTQSVCPLDLDEHLLVGTVDPVAYALVVDAITHDGPAAPARISRANCLRAYMPGVNPLDVKNNLAFLTGLPYVFTVPVPGVNIAGLPQLKSEPPLKCYVYASGC